MKGVGKGLLSFVILLAGLYVFAIGWLQWGTDVGTQTPWGWTGVSVSNTGCRGAFRCHKPPQQLRVKIPGWESLVLAEKSDCECVLCNSIKE